MNRRGPSGQLRILLALTLAVSGVLAIGAVGGQVAFAGGSPPECRYEDVITAHANPSEWKITLLDSIYMVPRSYQPPGLMSTSNAGLNGGERVRGLVIDDLWALARAARNANAGVRVVSAYRSYREQQSLYRQEVERFGVSAARLMVARPGHSEHHLGTTLDFGSAGTTKKGWHYNDWANTPAGSWMRANAWRFGFVMSYPKGRRAQTCYRYEPWHYRYVGGELAAKVRTSGLTLREYLWRQYH